MSLTFGLVDFLFAVFIAIFLIRFHGNSERLVYNDVLNGLNRLTAPLTLPFDKLLSKLSNKLNQRRNIDLSALCVAVILSMLAALFFIGKPLLILPLGLFFLLKTWLWLVGWAIFLLVIGSWLQADPRQNIMQLATACCAWLMKPLSRMIPPIGMLDFSPMVAIFILLLVNNLMENFFVSLLRLA